MSTKRYTSKVVAVNAFGEAIVPLPEDLVKELDWRLHDELDFQIDGDKVIIRNLSKEKREKK